MDAEAAKPSNPVAWPFGKVTSNVPGDGKMHNESVQLINDIESSLKGLRPWQEVAEEIQHWMNGNLNAGASDWNSKLGAEMIRQVLTAIFKSSGATDAEDSKFINLLKKIPPEVRGVMRDAALGGDNLNLKNAQDQWSNQQTADILLSTTDEADQTNI